MKKVAAKNNKTSFKVIDPDNTAWPQIEFTEYEAAVKFDLIVKLECLRGLKVFTLGVPAKAAFDKVNQLPRVYVYGDMKRLEKFAGEACTLLDKGIRVA